MDGPVTKLTCLCILGNYMVMFNLTGSASPATLEPHSCCDYLCKSYPIAMTRLS